MSNYFLGPFKCILVIVLLSAAALLLNGCKAQELPFETIEIQAGSNIYEGPNPQLVIIADRGQAHAIDGRISLQAQAALEALDYERYFAIAVFQGYKDSSGYGVQIESLMLETKTITVQALISDPEKGQVDIIPDGGYSPYHLVKVPEEGLHGALEFVLEVDGEALLCEPRSFP